MAIINHHFALDDARIKRLHNASVRSIRELSDVLSALDLRAVIYLEELEVAVPAPPAEKESEPE